MSQIQESFMWPIGLEFDSQEQYFSMITKNQAQNVVSLFGGGATTEMKTFRLILKSLILGAVGIDQCPLYFVIIPSFNPHFTAPPNIFSSRTTNTKQNYVYHQVLKILIKRGLYYPTVFLSI